MSSQTNCFASFEKESKISSLHRELNEKEIACWIRALVVIHSYTRTDRECMEFSRARFKTARIQRRNCRWLSCAHMFELRTLFTLIEEHRNVCANSASVLLSFPLCCARTHKYIDVCSGFKYVSYAYTYTVSGWAELVAQSYNVCAMGVYQEKKKIVTSRQTHC